MSRIKSFRLFDPSVTLLIGQVHDLIVTEDGSVKQARFIVLPNGLFWRFS